MELIHSESIKDIHIFKCDRGTYIKKGIQDVFIPSWIYYTYVKMYLDCKFPSVELIDINFNSDVLYDMYNHIFNAEYPKIETK
jgi:hypothetical protein